MLELLLLFWSRLSVDFMVGVMTGCVEAIGIVLALLLLAGRLMGAEVSTAGVDNRESALRMTLTVELLWC